MIYDNATSSAWRVYRDSNGSLVAERLNDGLIERPALEVLPSGKLALAFDYPDEVPVLVRRRLLQLLTM